MGLQFGKPHPNKFLMNHPVHIIDLRKAGSVYFIEHDQQQSINTNTSCDIQEKTRHLALCVDVLGASTMNEFSRFHYDLYVYSNTDYTTRVKMEYKKSSWNHYARIQKVGKIPIHEILVHYVPSRYADEIKYRLQRDVFNNLCRENNGPQWSSTLNCQTFTREAIKYLGCEFPDDVKMNTTCVPTMFNVYVQVSLSMGKTRVKTNRKLSI